MPKRIAILQSNYLPWKGYFDIIGSVDEFVIYDEVQYTKNDWRNRNKIKTPQGTQWITVPVLHKSLNQKISETKVARPNWGVKNWNALKTNYARAPFFREYSPPYEEFLRSFQGQYLSEINTSLILLVCSQLGIRTCVKQSTEYNLAGDPTEKLVSLCRQSNSSLYLSGPAAKDYLRLELFASAGIEVEWMDYSGYPEYNQMHPPFAHEVSILDLLFCMGPESKAFMKSRQWS